jgi:hypothetical protein
LDYRNYRGDLPEPPEWLRPHMHKLRYIGAVMIISTPVIGWLTVLKIVQITFFLYVLGGFSQLFGIVFFIIGLGYDTTVDRSE